jgi:hypothetical protein
MCAGGFEGGGISAAHGAIGDRRGSFYGFKHHEVFGHAILPDGDEDATRSAIRL